MIMHQPPLILPASAVDKRRHPDEGWSTPRIGGGTLKVTRSMFGIHRTTGSMAF
jgi:hypothetical protein